MSQHSGEQRICNVCYPFVTKSRISSFSCCYQKKQDWIECGDRWSHTVFLHSVQWHHRFRVTSQSPLRLLLLIFAYRSTHWPNMRVPQWKLPFQHTKLESYHCVYRKNTTDQTTMECLITMDDVVAFYNWKQQPAVLVYQVYHRARILVG